MRNNNKPHVFKVELIRHEDSAVTVRVYTN